MRWEIDSIIALQQLREQLPGLTALLNACSFLGKEEFFLLLIPLVYLCADTRVGIRLGLLVLLGDTLNLFGKLAFHAPRPYWLSGGVLPLSSETSFGLPSSHAQNAVSVWGFLALQLKRRWFWIVALCLVFLISLSRVYLGVHFWSDVVGGWMIGVLFLMLFLRFAPSVETWFERSTLRAQILASVALSFALLLLGGVLRAALPAPGSVSWAHFAAEASTLAPLVGRCGAICGLGIGWALSLRAARFNAGGPFAKRIVRFVIGLIGVLFFWKGLQLFLPHEPENIELVFRFLRYALLALWITFLAPWIFLRVGLAEPVAIAQE